MRLAGQLVDLMSRESTPAFLVQKDTLQNELERSLQQLDREPDRAWAEVQIRESISDMRQVLGDWKSPTRQKPPVKLDAALE
jgi:hypothetical protein